MQKQTDSHTVILMTGNWEFQICGGNALDGLDNWNSWMALSVLLTDIYAGRQPGFSAEHVSTV